MTWTAAFAEFVRGWSEKRSERLSIPCDTFVGKRSIPASVIVYEDDYVPWRSNANRDAKRIGWPHFDTRKQGGNQTEMSLNPRLNRYTSIGNVLKNLFMTRH
jgi:hypothetical protein